MVSAASNMWCLNDRPLSRSSTLPSTSAGCRGSHACSAVTPTPRRSAARKANPSAAMDPSVPSTPTTTRAAEGPGGTSLPSPMTATGQAACRATCQAGEPESGLNRPGGRARPSTINASRRPSRRMADPTAPSCRRVVTTNSGAISRASQAARSTTSSAASRAPDSRRFTRDNP